MTRKEVDAIKEKTGQTRAAIVAEHEHQARQREAAAQAFAEQIGNEEPTDLEGDE